MQGDLVRGIQPQRCERHEEDWQTGFSALPYQNSFAKCAGSCSGNVLLTAEARHTQRFRFACLLCVRRASAVKLPSNHGTRL